MEKTISLNENRLFRGLYFRGHTFSKKTMAVYVRKNRQKTVNRLGITVSVKLGGAVVRNKIRRRLKEVYRLQEHRLSAGWDIVIVARHAAADAPFTLLQQDLADIFAHLNLIADGSKDD